MKAPKHQANDDSGRNVPLGLPVVGVGSSAGGIEALKSFIAAVAPDSGVAYVIVQHLSPDNASVLTKILTGASRIPMAEIRQDMKIEANHAYVVPPNVMVEIVDEHLHLTPLSEPRGQRAPIDHFFASLARVKADHAACVILSGTGSDGTVGLRAVKEEGGLTVAQADAEYDGMMRSAVGTGLVDVVLPVTQIPAKLADYFRHLLKFDERRSSGRLQQEASDSLAQICAILRMRTGHDFSGYKDKTIARRVQRRMQVLQIDEVTKFIEHLRKEPQEVEALLKDLLIGVTNFFRDPAAFEALETKVIPRLFDGKGPNDAVRVWVPGCATGEEAYSISILLREHMPQGQGAPRVQIFASDIDEDALHIARIGRYPATIARDIPTQRLERYFMREDGTYRIASDLRENCLFASHNLLRDAPFSKLDLISCRNLLIYLTPELQNRLIPLFHYALNDSGYLFLGSSENVTRHARLFSAVDKASRIFQRRQTVERRLPEFPLIAPDGAKPKLAQAARRSDERESLQSLAERQVLDRYAPAHVVINSEGELLHASARTGKYLELAAGLPTNDVFRMARRGLRPDLRAAVHKAISSGEIAVQNNVVVGTNGGRQTIDLVVHPLRNAAALDNLFLVVFQDIGGIKSPEEGESLATVEDVESANLRQLETELRSTRERLQMTTEELESSNEELKSGNEELSSMNEELQSANEELETSKEELQSINEELQTVNAELNARVEELSRANSDIANLLESTQIATLFLDRNLAVKSFTPAAKDVFRLVESDTGRPITHVRARFSSDTVQEDAERVLRTLSTIEREVVSNDNGARYVMRMMPYRTVDNVIGGVVITFVDITQINHAKTRIDQLTHDLRDRIQSLETLLNLVPVGILIIEDNRTDQVRVNRYGAQVLGVGAEGSTPQPVGINLRLFNGERELPQREQPLQRAAHAGENVSDFEGQLARPDGSKLEVHMSATPLFDEEGKVRGAIASLLDISERKKSEAHQQVLLHELQHRVKNIIATIGALASRMLKDNRSPADFASAFQGRLKGMAVTHDLLSHGNWSGADLRALLEVTLRAHVSAGTSAVRLVGPTVLLTPNQAATIGMVFFELATNATKYGALSKAEGRVDVSWRVEKKHGQEMLTIDWREHDGPAITAPGKEGFGTGFIRRMVEYELNGQAELEFSPVGLRCIITFSLHA